jgi:hypothetical protein
MGLKFLGCFGYNGRVVLTYYHHEHDVTHNESKTQIYFVILFAETSTLWLIH